MEGCGGQALKCPRGWKSWGVQGMSSPTFEMTGQRELGIALHSFGEGEDHHGGVFQSPGVAGAGGTDLLPSVHRGHTGGRTGEQVGRWVGGSAGSVDGGGPWPPPLCCLTREWRSREGGSACGQPGPDRAGPRTLLGWLLVWG